MKIAVDAMGGDYAPGVVVEGDGGGNRSPLVRQLPGHAQQRPVAPMYPVKKAQGYDSLFLCHDGSLSVQVG